MRQVFPGPRRGVLLCILLAGFIAGWLIDLQPRQLNPGEGGVELAKRFFGAALKPHISEAGRDGLFHAVVQTLKIAFAAIGLSILLGLAMAYFCCEFMHPAIRHPFRVLMACLRSVHELLWATLFLAAFGMSPIAAVIALTIPYTGTFAKLYAEMIDEIELGPANSLHACGARSFQVFLFARLPLAFADMVSYTLYRLECAIRSSAVMGFMGITTLGYYLSTAYENAIYAEVWGYLYVLIVLVVVFERWSSLIRHRLNVGVQA